jgi:hypothetical protein
MGHERPVTTKPTVPEVLPLVRAYCAKPGNATGGSLHIVLDDGNIEDHHIRYCAEFAEKRGDGEGVELARLLLRMSRTQRNKVYRRLDGE